MMTWSASLGCELGVPYESSAPLVARAHRLVGASNVLMTFRAEACVSCVPNTVPKCSNSIRSWRGTIGFLRTPTGSWCRAAMSQRCSHIWSRSASAAEDDAAMPAARAPPEREETLRIVTLGRIDVAKASVWYQAWPGCEIGREPLSCQCWANCGDNAAGASRSDSYRSGDLDG